MKVEERSSHREMRKISIQKILSAMQAGHCTKISIQEETGLSWGSCSTLINHLNEKNLISISGNKENTGRGRKTSKYEFSEKAYLMFGMEIRSDEILCSIINLGKKELYRNTFQVSEQIKTTNITAMVSSAFMNSLVELGVKSDVIIGLSIALAGGVDVKNKKWLSSPRIKSINKFSFNTLFNNLPRVPYTFIEHDIHAQASSVIQANDWKDNNYAFLHFGRGISMSIYDNGLFLGSRGFAGEIGHIPCPNFNINNKSVKTIESILSTHGILSIINEKHQTSYTKLDDLPNEIIEDSSLHEIIYKTLEFAIIVTVNIIDPQTIIIGGSSIEPFYDFLHNDIADKVKSVTWNNGPEKIKWYKHADMHGAFGTIYNSSDKITDSIIESELL